MKTYRQNKRKQLCNRTKSNRTKSNRKQSGGIGGDLFCKSKTLMLYINGMIPIIKGDKSSNNDGYYITMVKNKMIELSSKPEEYLQKITCKLETIKDTESEDSYIKLMIYQNLINFIINGIESDIKANNATLPHTLEYYQELNQKYKNLNIKVDNMIANHKYTNKTLYNKDINKLLEN